ncbi:hypothetical protein BC629DRAFT_683596 [Irpex lacteus]|nr:hypothetical protein BC629DRAFT_683596 [Irpex lacteus]
MQYSQEGLHKTRRCARESAQADESKATPDDDWLSDLDSEPEKTKELIRTIKQPRSPSPSAQLDALLNDIDESKKLQIPPKAPPHRHYLRMDHPRGRRGRILQSTRPDRPRSHDADFPPSLKRKLESSSDSNGKKRHNISPSQDFLVSSQNDLENPRGL